MKKKDYLLLLLAAALVSAMLLTFLLGGNRSRHGYGAQRQAPAGALQGVTSVNWA